MRQLYTLITLGCLLLLAPIESQAASLVPSVLDVHAQRGAVLTEELLIVNPTSETQTYYLGVMAFRPSDDGASPVFMPELPQDGLATWISFAEPIVQVNAMDQLNVPFAIALPADVASGSYYAAVTVSGSPSDVVASNGAVIEAKTASLVFVTVEGETVARVAFLDLNDHLTDVRSILEMNASYRLQNQGNVHVIPVGTLTLTDVFGRTLQQVALNEEQGRVLPGTTRTYTINTTTEQSWWQRGWNQWKQPAIGPITATLTLNVSENASPITYSWSFWYVPWALLVDGGIVLLILFWIIKKRS